MTHIFPLQQEYMTWHSFIFTAIMQPMASSEKLLLSGTVRIGVI